MIAKKEKSFRLFADGRPQHRMKKVLELIKKKN